MPRLNSRAAAWRHVSKRLRAENHLRHDKGGQRRRQWDKIFWDVLGDGWQEKMAMIGDKEAKERKEDFVQAALKKICMRDPQAKK